MNRRLSDLTPDELRREIDRLQRDVETKRNQGLMAEAEVLEQRLFLAKSYLCDPRAFRPGETYRVVGEDRPFRLDFVRGVMAWGHLEGETEARAFPLGRLYR
ncbi:MAG: DUF1811 family protein [Bacillota bacterium]|nr:DUF1811 domain-containing protein [Bacillota bacterium]